jgi:hypothetical protein
MYDGSLNFKINYIEYFYIYGGIDAKRIDFTLKEKGNLSCICSVFY